MSKENKIIYTFQAIKSAIELRRKHQRHFWGEVPDIPDFLLVLSTLKPLNLKIWIRNASSYNHGAHILDQVFPKYENPTDFHSTPFETVISETPVQVLGWDDVEKLKKEGVEAGLDRKWIIVGFEWRAIERGIDLEWSFFAEPPHLDLKPLT